MAKKRKPKEKTLKSKLDAIYSTYIRKSSADYKGYIECYCGVQVPWQDAHCSHYIPRGCLALRYEPRNTHASCVRCNLFMHGNLQAYAIFLQSKYGEGILQWLDKERRKIVKNYPYEEKITYYTQAVKDLDNGTMRKMRAKD